MSGLFDLTGKTALVTGGNRGIGLAFARGLATQGAQVTIWGRDAARNAEAAEVLRGAARQIDVRDEEAVTAAMAAHGVLDILVVNAGLIDRRASLDGIDGAAWRDVMATNLDAAFYTLREGAKAMVAGGKGGSIIVCGSLSIFAGTRGLEHYAASKGALAAIVKSMASELGEKGIRVNMIAPGYIETEGAARRTPDAGIAGRTPMRRLGVPADLEAAVAYLASDGARFHTGDVLVIDGGWLANLC